MIVEGCRVLEVGEEHDDGFTVAVFVEAMSESRGDPAIDRAESATDRGGDAAAVAEPDADAAGGGSRKGVGAEVCLAEAGTFGTSIEALWSEVHQVAREVRAVPFATKSSGSGASGVWDDNADASAWSKKLSGELKGMGGERNVFEDVVKCNDVESLVGRTGEEGFESAVIDGESCGACAIEGDRAGFDAEGVESEALCEAKEASTAAADIKEALSGLDGDVAEFAGAAGGGENGFVIIVDAAGGVVRGVIFLVEGGEFLPVRLRVEESVRAGSALPDVPLLGAIAEVEVSAPAGGAFVKRIHEGLSASWESGAVWGRMFWALTARRQRVGVGQRGKAYPCVFWLGRSTIFRSRRWIGVQEGTQGESRSGV